MMELLAPAGNMDSVIAAVRSGADAIYIGGKKFSARRSAENFSNEEILEVVKYCHLRGVDVHIAANILIKPDETDEFLSYMEFLNSASVDAVIIQDIGMAKVTKAAYPDLTLHASTQLTATSLESVRYLEEMGFSRVVLARELSFDEIKYICDNAKAEIEVFVHGAICMCYSGQCLMSSIIGARSGNRGMCAQPCRLPYKLIGENETVKEGYLLSPKDMSLVKDLNTLKNLGVKSLKIEGRLKRPEYVATVLKIYKKYLESGEKISNEDYSLLEDSFSRSGFTNGYFLNKLGAEMMSYEVPGNTAENTFSAEIIELCKGNIEKRRPIDIECKMCKDEKLYIRMTDGDFSAVAESDVLVEKAINRPIERARLEEQIKKLGDSVFFARDIKITMDDDAIIPIKEINATRRRACEILSKEILKREEKRVLPIPEVNVSRKREDVELSAKVSTALQLKAAEDSGIKTIYIRKNLIPFAKKEDIDYVVILPEICDDKKADIPKRFGVLISNVGQERQYRGYKMYGNTRLNVLNQYSAEVFSDYRSVALSYELNLKEIEKIDMTAKKEVVCYGKIPLMIMKNCPVRSITKMCKKDGGYRLKDRKNQEFSMTCDDNCHSVLLNSKNIFMADKIKDLKKSGIEIIRLDFYDEDYLKTKEIIELYKKAISGGVAESPEENTFTRGHFYRGVL